MNGKTDQDKILWKMSAMSMVLIVGAILLLIFTFSSGLEQMVLRWETSEEYGYGYLIPVIALFFIWQKKNELAEKEFTGSWLGVICVILGAALLVFGELAALYVITQYAFIVTVFGVLLSLLGWQAMKVIIVPVLLLFFMVPLPNFLNQGLSSELQLISSSLGVWFIRLLGISVFLEGNVIDLGVYKLQVVEACSGLNYLFPLMTLAFISAYFFTGAPWKKAIIFLSSIPVTVFMNSFRIGVIGVTVEYWGPEMAEGFLHDFEGWAVFMSCITILIGEMWILAHIGKDKLPLREAFGLDFPEPTPKGVEIISRETPKLFYASFVIITIVAVSAFALPEREEIIPDRKYYSDFPLELKGWEGRTGFLERAVIDTLKLTDYAMIDYRGEDGGLVNFYSAYYDSQKKGASAHSPRSCIPGGGWRIASLKNHKIQGANVGNVPMVVNRLLIEKGEVKQLVYYWFQQRGRIVTNEYMMKWYLFWDAVTKSRTDGALMRLTTLLKPGQDIEIADDRLEAFTREISPVIHEYVPL